LNPIPPYSSCPSCNGRGKLTRKLKKKTRLHYQKKLEQYKTNKYQSAPPIKPSSPLIPCADCSGSGVTPATSHRLPDTINFPHVAIIGGGIGGTALAVAFLHRGIPFTLYERDNNFDDRSQGYGLTLQQASKAIQGFGIFSLPSGIISTRHVVYSTDGKIVGEWGKRKWSESKENTSAFGRKRTNIHIARQSLRLELFKRLNGNKNVQWGHQLIDIKQNPATNNDVADQPLELTFQVNGKEKNVQADLVIGADGIRSTVRKLLVGEQNTPLNYLGCIVILGICKLSALEDQDNTLLDSATVFQTANGKERIYMMPYSSDEIMWQLSFPMSEKDALLLSKKGVEELKKEAIRRTPWHDPIPQIVKATLEEQISGYPVYDRDLLTQEELQKNSQATLIGDAAHPMSPFKGQGANQALLDALALARLITKECRPKSEWKKRGIRDCVLNDFESEMLTRSASKVAASADAAQFLHSDVVLQEIDKPRGKSQKKDVTTKDKE